MNSPVPIIIIALAVIAAIIYMIYLQSRKRREAMREVSSRLGLQYIEDETFDSSSYSFDIFNKGYHRKVKNLIKGYSQGADITLFDYKYTVSSSAGTSSSAHTYYHSICLLEKNSFDIPDIFIRREHIGDKIAEKFGKQDIDFEDDRLFSKSFVLRGDEDRLRQIFNPGLRSFLMEQKKSFSRIEGSGNVLLVSRNKRIKPQEFEHLREFAGTILQALIG